MCKEIPLYSKGILLYKSLTNLCSIQNKAPLYKSGFDRVAINIILKGSHYHVQATAVRT